VLELEKQLAQLRQRIAHIDHKYKLPATPSAPDLTPKRSAPRVFIEEWASGEVINNEHGPHFQMEKLYEGHRHHGSADIGALSELPHDLLDALGNGEISPVAPQRWAFLDTETTGLAGGSGTYAFLIGVGRITPDGFRVRQFFMREYAEEKSLLCAVTAHLQEFDVLITYNGKTYDQPLLETRYRMTRQKPPFGRLQHLDLLHGARRLWKLRFDSCKLTHLENQILGVEREGDLPGEMIPYVYFEYLRLKEAQKLVPIFHHNALDILTLGCLTGIVPAAFRSTDMDSLRSLGLRRGEEYLGIAKWVIAAGDCERGLDLLKRSVDAGLPDTLLFRTLWEIARLEKKMGRPEAAVRLLTELTECRNPFRACAFEELAKYYEHTERNYGLALEFTVQAMNFTSSDGLTRRSERLEAKLQAKRLKQKPRLLL
jgi:uncharacterized protein YprB with RNaseH-like and TPR domain